MDPRDAQELWWDDDNYEHFEGRRGIHYWEAEEVFANGPVFTRNPRSGGGDYFMIGQTDSGNFLTIVVDMLADWQALLPITAWHSTAAEKDQYRRMRRRG